MHLWTSGYIDKSMKTLRVDEYCMTLHSWHGNWGRPCTWQARTDKLDQAERQRGQRRDLAQTLPGWAVPPIVWPAPRSRKPDRRWRVWTAWFGATRLSLRWHCATQTVGSCRRKKIPIRVTVSVIHRLYLMQKRIKHFTIVTLIDMFYSREVEKYCLMNSFTERRAK